MSEQGKCPFLDARRTQLALLRTLPLLPPLLGLAGKGLHRVEYILLEAPGLLNAPKRREEARKRGEKGSASARARHTTRLIAAWSSARQLRRLAAQASE